MLVAARGATGYSWRGLRYTWKGDGDAIEVPDELGSYLVTKRTEFWYEPVAPPPPAPVVDRAAPPSIGIAKGPGMPEPRPDTKLPKSAHDAAVRRFEGD